MNNVLVSVSELDTLIKNNAVIVVDTRDKAEYEKGHIPGAVNIREMFTYLAVAENGGLETMIEKFAELFGSVGISEKDHVVIYEDLLNNGYGQSCRGYFLLKYLGSTQVSVLHGGLAAWKQQGLPLETDVITRHKVQYTPRTDMSLMVSTEEMKAALGNPNISILDVRDRDEWIGESSSPYGKDFAPRKGRIPGAVWIEWYDFMEKNADGIPMMVSNDKILEMTKKVGMSTDKTVYVYCFKGSRASNTLIALQNAGFRDVRNYFPSWNDWSRNPELPIDDTVLV
jgi:thiosulfate/3-mercaptopyruvate sulfurtransferase